MTVAIVLLSLALGAYLLAVIERWAVHGHLSLTGPAWAALALRPADFAQRIPAAVEYNFLIYLHGLK